MIPNRVAVLVKGASLNFDKMANPILKEYGLTSAQYKILKYLFMHEDESVRLVDIENYYSITHPTTIGLIQQLETKGFVRKEENPEDARSKVIKLTDKALEERNVVEDIGIELEKKLTTALSDSEREQLIGLLQKMLTAFD